MDAETVKSLPKTQRQMRRRSEGIRDKQKAAQQVRELEPHQRGWHLPKQERGEHCLAWLSSEIQFRGQLSEGNLHTLPTSLEICMLISICGEVRMASNPLTLLPLRDWAADPSL